MTNEEKIALLIRALKEVQDQEFTGITEDTEFEDLGLDSLDAVEIQIFIEEALGLETKDPSGEIKTVGDFLKLIP